MRKASYDFDSQSVRPYFAFDRVKQGLFDVTEQAVRRDVPAASRRAGLGQVRRSLRDAVEDGQVIGRFYLDMHPRKDKYNHAAEFPIRTGVDGRGRFPKPRSSAICRAARPAIPAS